MITDRAPALEAAYARCEEITNTEARNFSYGIRLLPPAQRQAMSALYAMARRVDDIGDGDLPPDEKVVALREIRTSLGRVRDGDPPPEDAVLLALADAATRFPIPLAAFDELVDGCEMDATGFVYGTADELVGYCRRVAGSIGRLSLGVFGLTGGEASRPVAEVRADALGVALQLTNILRDVVEDRGMGRVYLPAEDRRRFGCADDLTGPPDAVADLVRFEGDRARAWFTDGLQLLPMLDRRSRACVAAMAGIYRRLLERIARQPAAVLDGRMSVPTWEKAWVAARSLAGSATVTVAARPRTGARPSVAVVGGGLAGVTAALDLADAGLAVRLYEQRQRLGGATWSFRRKGLRLDNGQHVFLRCCTAYRAFLERIGAADDVVLQDRLAIPVFGDEQDVGAPPARLSRAALPAPWHLAPAILRSPHLPWRDRLRAGPAVLALRRLDRERPDLDDRTFGEWLAAHGQSPTAVARLWDLITVPTVNLAASEASLATAAMVFQVGLLTDPAAADIGWSRVPLGVLHGDRTRAALAAAGVDVQLGADVEAIDERGVTVGGTHREVDGVVVAVPHERAQQLVPAGARRDASDWAALGRSPIVTVHVVYDRRITDLAMAAVLGEPNLWLFDRTDGSGLDPAAGQYLAVTVSAASAWIGRRPSELIAEVTARLARRFPVADRATVVDAVVSREHAATFRATPGSAGHRPPTETAWPRLVLAGAWTDTGWPATMEGAVRSGHRAAVALRQVLDGPPARTLLPVPAARPVRRSAFARRPLVQEVPA